MYVGLNKGSITLFYQQKGKLEIKKWVNSLPPNPVPHYMSAFV